MAEELGIDTEHKMVGSMSRPACPYDNSCLESFFSTAKRECIYRKDYDSIDEVKRDSLSLFPAQCIR